MHVNWSGKSRCQWCFSRFYGRGWCRDGGGVLDVLDVLCVACVTDVVLCACCACWCVVRMLSVYVLRVLRVACVVYTGSAV